MSTLPQSDFPILTSVKELREWRAELTKEGKSVGFVPTMGALHDGHLSLGESSTYARRTLCELAMSPELGAEAGKGGITIHLMNRFRREHSL